MRVFGSADQRRLGHLTICGSLKDQHHAQVSPSSLTVVSYILLMVTFAFAPRSRRFSPRPAGCLGGPASRTFSSYVRIVPVILTVSGTMLGPVPPLMVPMVTTTGDSVRLAFRLTTVWRPEMTRADVVIGSTVFHGMPPCP